MATLPPAADPAAEAGSLTTDSEQPQNMAAKPSSDTDNPQPTQSVGSLVILLASILLAMFIVGLDRTIIATVSVEPLGPYPRQGANILSLGNAPDHRRIQLLFRPRLVWRLVSPDILCLAAPVRKGLHRLLHQMGTARQHPVLRSRLSPLRRRSQFSGLHHRQIVHGGRRRWNLGWCCKSTIELFNPFSAR